MPSPYMSPNLNVGGTTHSVVFVATQNNSIYAFDADKPQRLYPSLAYQPGHSPPEQRCELYLL